MTTELSAWRPFVFSAPLTRYSHPIIAVFLTHMYMVVLCSDNFSTVFYRIIFFSHWKQGGVALTALSALVAPWVVSATISGATGDGGVYRLDDPCFQCWFDMIFTQYLTVICASLKCIWYFSFVHLFYYAWTISLPYYHSIIFFLLKVADRRLVVADGTVSCHGDNLRCHWWWQASRSFVLGAQKRALSALFMC